MNNLLSKFSQAELTNFVLVAVALASIAFFAISGNYESIADREASVAGDEELARLLAKDRWPGRHTQLLLDMTKELNKGRSIRSIDDVVFPTVQDVRAEAKRRGDPIAMRLEELEGEAVGDVK